MLLQSHQQKMIFHFFSSSFGQCLNNQDTFSFVIDINRQNEYPSQSADTRFIRQLREFDFESHYLVFTSD